MIQRILPLILLTLVACEKESNEFKFDYKITRSYTIDGLYGDSLVYYYDNNNKLLKVDRFHAPETASEYYVYYKDEMIENWNGNYIFGSNNQINSIENIGNLTEIQYSSDKIIYKKHTANNFTSEENFFQYMDGNLTKDSTIIYHDDSEPSITVYRYEYTDTLIKDFMLDFSGLYEMPLTSKKLLRTAKSIEHDILYKYSYDISENEIIQYADFYDLNYNTKNETTRTVYILNKN